MIKIGGRYLQHISRVSFIRRLKYCMYASGADCGMMVSGIGGTPCRHSHSAGWFDELRRSTEFRWASQERLTRRSAQQAVGIGEEKITLKGAIFPGVKGGIKQLDTLRSLGSQLKPLTLTSGYGDVLGTWCLKNVEEEHSALLQGGIPRKQAFTLEFARYGDDLQNV